MILEASTLSDVGQTRDHNEDYLGMYHPPEMALRRAKGELFLVADGVGGHQAGEVASRAAVEQVIQVYADRRRSPGRDPLAELVNAITHANSAVYNMGQDQDNRWRMSTTLVGALIHRQTLHVVNVGDSRAYLVRNGQAEQVSQDHSLVAEQVRMGLVEEDQAKELGYRSAITRALGSKPDVKVDTFTRTLQAGDIVVLCTDGLSGLVNAEEIAHTVSAQPPAQAVVSLVEMANARGGPDNITTIVVKTYAEEKNRIGPLGWLFGLLAALALTLAILLALVPLTLGWGRDLPDRPPRVAPVEMMGDQADIAQALGYANERDVLIKTGLSPDQPWPALKPRVTYVLLVGEITHLATDRPCDFTMTMSDVYTVHCSSGVRLSSHVSLARGEQVSVLGVLIDEAGRQVEALSVDVNKVKWLGLGSQWQNAYMAFEPGRQLLVYTVVGPYTVLEAEGRNLVRDYGFVSGDEIAVYGFWKMVSIEGDHYVGPVSFDRVFRLEDDRYKQVSP